MFVSVDRFVPENMASLGKTVGKIKQYISLFLHVSEDENVFFCEKKVSYIRLLDFILSVMIVSWMCLLLGSLLSQHEPCGSSWSLSVLSLLLFNGQNTGLLESEWKYSNKGNTRLSDT